MTLVDAMALENYPGLNQLLNVLDVFGVPRTAMLELVVALELREDQLKRFSDWFKGEPATYEEILESLRKHYPDAENMEDLARESLQAAEERFRRRNDTQIYAEVARVLREAGQDIPSLLGDEGAVGDVIRGLARSFRASDFDCAELVDRVSALYEMMSQLPNLLRMTEDADLSAKADAFGAVAYGVLMRNRDLLFKLMWGEQIDPDLLHEVGGSDAGDSPADGFVEHECGSCGEKAGLGVVLVCVGCGAEQHFDSDEEDEEDDGGGESVSCASEVPEESVDG